MYRSLVEALGKSRLLLPAAARRFQDWDVGILERFDARDVGLIGEGVAEILAPKEKEGLGKGDLENMVKRMAEVKV